jgi:chitodextrinase
MSALRRFGYTSLAVATVTVLGGGLISAPAAHAATEPVEIVVNGDHVLADNKNGLTFKGLGVISGNSTSNLLMDYKAESPDQYWQLIDVLFGGEYPLLDHVKMEMGSDTNNSTGAEAATMRTAEEYADASRSPGFQLAADAKTVNPKVKVSFLRWNMPQWVQTPWAAGTGNDEMYTWYKETILDAYEKYGYMVDYVSPDTNETTNPDVAFVKWYKDAITTDTDFSNVRYGIPVEEQAAVEAAYKSIKIVASDENTSLKIGPALLGDADLFDAVDAVGYHYNTDDRREGAPDSVTFQPYTKLATGQNSFNEDKEVWYSEGTGSFGFTDYRVNNTEGPGGASTGIGGVQSALDLANRVVKGYANSKRTHYIFQPAIGSFYEGAQYSHKELLSARDPWSGAIHYDAAIYVMQHFTRFATTGWENDDNTAGIWRTIPQASYSGVSGTENVDGANGAASYMTLADPKKTDFSTVVVNDSDQTKTYRITTENMDLGDDQTLEAWETRAAGADESYDSSFMRLADAMQPGDDGYYTATVRPRSIVTLTTLDRSADPTTAERVPESVERTVLDTDATGKNRNTDDGMLYADDFEYAEEAGVQVGVDNGARKQQVDYLASRGNEPRYFVDQSGAWQVGESPAGGNAMYQLMDQSMKDTKAWNPRTPNTLLGDFRWQNYTAKVDVAFPDPAGGLASLGIRQQQGMGVGDAAYNVRIQPSGAWTFYRHDSAVASGTVPAKGEYTLAVQGAGSTVTTSIDGAVVSTFVDPKPELGGRVNLGSGFFSTAFDDLTIEKVPGFAPYASALIDNMDSAVAYEGAWNHKSSGGDAMDWHRSTSTGSAAGASFTVPFSGTGIDVIGGNDGGAIVDVFVDGKPLADDAPTASSGKRLATYSLRGLADGDHTAKFVLVSGSLVVDAFHSVSGDVDGPVDTKAIADAAEDVGNPAQADYSETTWAVFDATRTAAVDAVGGQPGLDAIGVGQLAARLTAASDRLRPADITDAKLDLGLAGAVATTGALPATMTIDGQARAVSYTNASEAASTAPYTTLPVEGWTDEAYVDGKKQAFTARFEVVPPSLVYFIDSGLAGNQTSPQYTAVADGRGLKNDTADRVSTSATAWGHVADGMVTKTGTDPADKYSTGLYAAANKTVQYRLPLEAGDYVLTAGFREWWAQNRPMSHTVIIGDKSVAGTPVNLSAGTPTASGTVSFTLTEATTVTYRVAKTGSQDPVISWLGVARAATAPGVPTDVVATAGDGTATVGWKAPASDGDSAITGYTVSSDVGDAACATTGATECVVDGLLNGTAYAFTVVAHNAVGDSAASSASTPVTPQQPPVVSPAWSATVAYLAGDTVSHNGATYVAQWWTQGAKPGASVWSAWSQIGEATACQGAPVLEWTPSTIYTGGEIVTHSGRKWAASWWTRSQTPGDPWGPWRDLGAC